MTLGAMLSGALAPCRVSHGNWASVERSDQERFKNLDGKTTAYASENIAHKRETNAPLWIQALEEGSGEGLTGEHLKVKPWL